MDFTTLRFLAFLAGVALLNRLIPARFRASLILVASYAFYWTWSGGMALLLLGATAAAFFAGITIEKASTLRLKQAVMAALVVSLLLVLVTFKSAPFLGPIIGGGLLMPLGISYYIFKLVSYVVDVYWGKISSERKFIPFAAFVAFFPQIVAGPIQRGESLLLQLIQPNPPDRYKILVGVQRILLGYFKKFVVADNLSILVNYVYGHVYDPGTPLILGYYAYPLQMYADFSGLTDIAIGSALLLGIESPENFNAPFSSASPSEYWRRWHITLTTWLTDYVFTPLRMATRQFGNAGLVFSLVVNMVLIGLWHGFRLPFALFGLIHAAYLAVDALSARNRKKFYKSHPKADRVTTLLGPIVTFHLVAIAFVFFRGVDLSSILYFLGHIAQGTDWFSAANQSLYIQSGRAILVGLAGYGVMEFADYIRRMNNKSRILDKLPSWGRQSLYACTAVTVLFVLLLLIAGGENRNPFLYAIF